MLTTTVRPASQQHALANEFRSLRALSEPATVNHAPARVCRSDSIIHMKINANNYLLNAENYIIRSLPITLL
jgi:hypothetical protein